MNKLSLTESRPAAFIAAQSADRVFGQADDTDADSQEDNHKDLASLIVLLAGEAR